MMYSDNLTLPESVRIFDKEACLDGVIVIRPTALGPGAGGCRLWTYSSIEEAETDALRLSQGMSYKNALAGLPLSGAKAVLRRPDGEFDRASLFRAFGRAVEDLGGRYVTAEDVGTSVNDMTNVATATRHVAGLAPAVGRAGGDPSPWTAKGVFESIRTAAGSALGGDLKGMTVAVQGVGNVGADLCRRLADAGAHLVIADPDPSRRNRLEHILGAHVVSVDQILMAEADILAPCALGGTLDVRTVENLKVKLVCGAANNQLATPEVAQLLQQRDITYVPDYVVNAGGIISVSAEYLGEDLVSVEQRVSAIAPRVMALLQMASAERRSPAAVADDMAKSVIAQAGRVTAA
jgi:leucine dehydrogenase